MEALKQEIKDYTELLRKEQTRFRISKTILDSISDIVKASNCSLDNELKAKIQNILLEGRVRNLKIAEEIDEPSLDYIESNILTVLLSEHLNKLLLDYNEIEVMNDDFYDFYLKYLEQQTLYRDNLKLLEQSLNELITIRLKRVPEAVESKSQENEVKALVDHLKSLLAMAKTRMMIFKESDHSLNAFKVYISDLKIEEEQLKEDIQKLKDNKQKYSMVSCPEYDKVLKSYLQFKASLEKKRAMLNLCI